MVERQIESRGVKNKDVLEAMRKVPRHLFMPEHIREYAYSDSPLDIGYHQTISQPYIVAFMTEAAAIDKESIILDVGTGSGYQAAVLAEISKEVYSIEIVEQLGKRSGELLHKLYKNIHTKIGDGYEGWPDKAPFDAIIIAAALKKIPEKLIAQLKIEGRIIMPFEDFSGQKLIRVRKIDSSNKYRIEELMDVRFVPMTGQILL